MGKIGIKVSSPGSPAGESGPDIVAMLGSMPPIRGLSSYCLEFSLAIADFSKVHFISFKKIYPNLLYPGRDLKDDDTFPSITHTNLWVKRRLTWYNPITWIQEGLFTRGALLHAQWWSLPLALIYIIVCLGFKLRKKPVVFTVHNIQPHEKSFIYNLVTKILFKLGNHFIVHSATNKAQLIEHYNIPPECVTQMPHGPLDFHVCSEMNRNQIRTEMGFAFEDKVILMFGAIRPYKGIETVLRAFAEVLPKIPESRLLVAGKLWESWQPYQRLIEQLSIGDRITTHLKYIPSGEVWKFFVASDLVILPYHHFDSQSGVGATAISFRKPLIVTDVGGLPELVADPRYVVPAKNPAILSKKIVQFIQDPKQLCQMSEETETVAAKMAWSSIAQKTWAVYRKVLEFESMRVI